MGGEYKPQRYNRNHNALNMAVFEAVSAIAVGAVILGDKGQPENTAHLNASHTVDVAWPRCRDWGIGGRGRGGDDGTGNDCLYETKCVNSLVKSLPVGLGSNAKGGAPAAMGHRIAHGNTAEHYCCKLQGLGVRSARRSGAEPPIGGRRAQPPSKNSRITPTTVRAGLPSALQTCSKTPLLAGVDPHIAGRRDGPSWMASVTRRSTSAGGQAAPSTVSAGSGWDSLCCSTSSATRTERGRCSVSPVQHFNAFAPMCLSEAGSASSGMPARQGRRCGAARWQR
jgi:hypothetical protein